MYERFHGREPYTVFTDEALYSYCHFGLVPAPDHDPGFRLACRPVTEASVYMAAHSNGRIYDSIRAINIPVLILRAQEPTPNKPVQNYSVSPTWPGLVDSFHSAREIYYPDCTHFLPMEIPDEIAQRIREQLGSHAKQDEGAAR